MKKINKPLVSVIIPVFNGASYLEEAVNSVKNSDYKKIEILLIDDGSTDKSKIICKKLEKKHENVRFYSFTENTGMGRVLNFALEKATGEYICRINQDDLMIKHRIRTQVKFLQDNPKVVAVGSYIKLFDEKNQPTIVQFLEKDTDIKKTWLMLSPFSDPSVMYRKKIALQVGGYNQSFWPADDVHLWYRMGKIGKLANIPKVMVEVRWHDKAGSLKFMKINAVKTYALHLWADKEVEKAALSIRLFWFCELLAGLILPARWNWAAYRFIKKILNITVNIVIPHPKKLSISGA